MPASATRMLVLGVVQIFGPANGYQLRRELLSWGVQSWARVNPGSIYSMLATLAKHGHVDQVELAGSDYRAVTVYRPTASGTAEFRRIVELALRTVDQTNPTDFRAAMSFALFLTREQFLAACADRQSSLDHDRAEIDRVLGPHDDGGGRLPPHVAVEMQLERAVRDVERVWLARVIADVQNGGLQFEGEDGPGWIPPDDDPGWRMHRDRQRYLTQLADLP